MTETPDPLPVLAIVGRPNVGKSALFNRILGTRMAIVHAQHGVTRDRISADTEWDGRCFRLLDTGGIEALDGAHPENSIAEGIRRQADAAIAEAAILIHVVDVYAGLTPMDREVSRVLRRSGRPILVAANKADNTTREEQAVDFEALGHDVFPVSALHNRGIGTLMARATEGFPESGTPAATPGEPPLRVAVLGRPNAGKSSFINALLGESRVMVSDIPGTTRDRIDIPFSIGHGPDARRYVLCDTAGLRAHGKVHDAVEHYSHLRVEDTVRGCEVTALLIDAVRGPSRQDKRIASLIQAEHKACVLMVNKWDLAEGQKETVYATSVRAEMPFLDFAPLLFISAKTGYRVRPAIGVLDRVSAAYARTVTTGVLNRALHDAFERTRPPAVRGRPLKFYYATQVGSRPPRFRLFVNNPDRVVDAYQSYLVRRLRETFDFEGSPVILRFVARGQRSVIQSGKTRTARRTSSGGEADARR